MRAVYVAVVVVCLACGDDDGGSAGASELDACEGAALCIFGSGDPDADAFVDVCVDDGIFAPASPECRACMLDLSCADLEAALEGDTAAQAMCPSCE